MTHRFLALGNVGMIFGTQFDVKLPAFKGFTNAGGELLWPLLFVTVACGAISGFHTLVAGGTIIAPGTIVIAGTMLQGGPTVVYGQSLGKFAGLLGIDQKVGMSLDLLTLNSFILTSLDTAARLSRYQFQELFNMKDF
jgi:carbon starvation protein